MYASKVLLLLQEKSPCPVRIFRPKLASANVTVKKAALSLYILVNRMVKPYVYHLARGTSWKGRSEGIGFASNRREYGARDDLPVASRAQIDPDA